MNPDAKIAVLTNLLQIEESYRDKIVQLEQERYRKTRDILSKLMTTEVVISAPAAGDAADEASQRS